MSTVDPVARATATGSANSDGREPGVDERSRIDGERPLIIRQSRAIRVNQAVAVEHHDGRSGGTWVHALGDELALQEGGDADRRATRAEEHEAVGGQAPTLSASGKETGEDDRSGSLDVVVEARLPVAVAGEDAHRIVALEILPLDDGRREHPGHRLHERLDDRIVGRAAQARRPVSDVQRIVKELAAVGPYIERDGQGVRRIDARGCRVQGQLSDRDRHPAGSLVAQAQDALVVGDDDQADVVAGRPQDAIDPADVVRGDPDPTRTPDDVTELLTGKTDRRRVDDREEFLEVLDQQPIEQGLVAVLESGQSDVPLEFIGLAPDVLQFQRNLLVDRCHTRWQEPVQAEGVAFIGREG